MELVKMKKDVCKRVFIYILARHKLCFYIADQLIIAEMTKILDKVSIIDFSFCKDMFEKSGKLRQFRCGEHFVHSGYGMELW